MITFAQTEEDKDSPERLILKDNDSMAGIIGCICVLSTALLNGVIAVQTRMMQKMSVLVTMFYIALFSVIGTWGILLIEYGVADHDKLRIMSLTSEQFWFGILSGAVNFCSLACKTVAYQNEKSGLITMIGYIGLVYGFLSDTFIFEQSIGGLEIAGVLIILIMNVLIVFFNKPAEAMN